MWMIEYVQRRAINGHRSGVFVHYHLEGAWQLQVGRGAHCADHHRRPRLWAALDLRFPSFSIHIWLQMCTSACVQSLFT